MWDASLEVLQQALLARQQCSYTLLAWHVASTPWLLTALVTAAGFCANRRLVTYWLNI